MIYRELKNNVLNFKDNNFIIQGNNTYSFRDTLEMTDHLVEEFKSRLLQKDMPFILIQLQNSFELLTLTFSVNAIKGDLCIANSDFNESEIKEIIERFKFTHFITDENYTNLSNSIEIIHPNELFHDIDSRQDKIKTTNNHFEKIERESKIIILTTGTTGAPKGAIYSWEELSKQIARSEKYLDTRWLLVYKLNHFAAIQVFLTTLFNKSCLVLLEKWEPDYVVSEIFTKKPEYISATPTFWRMILPVLSKSSKKFDFIKHITVGGEAVTSNILDKIKELLPLTTIAQIFATTEVGPVFSVKDFKIGFPLDYIHNPEEHGLRAELKIIDNELYVKTKYPMEKYYKQDGNPIENGWCPTGDIVRVEGDRVLFLGRKTEIINIGGVKVHPLEIEELIQTVEGVLLVKVSGRKNPITGQIVIAEVVLEKGYNEIETKNNILTKCKNELSRYKIPRMIKIVNELEIANLKITRKVDKNEK